MNTLTRFVLSFFFIAFLVVSSGEVVAQQRNEIKAADTSSPRATLKSFIDACNEVYQLVDETGYLNRNSAQQRRLANRVNDCLDMSETPQFARFQRAGEVAVCIKEILDREEIPDWDQIPDIQEIEAAGGFEELSTWRIPGTRITIARVNEGPQKHEYLFSPGTVSRAVDYFESVREEPYRTDGPAVSEGFYDAFLSAPGHPFVARIINNLPESFRKQRILGLAAWKWPGVLLAIFIALTLVSMCYRLQWKLTPRAREKGIFWYWLVLAFPMVTLLVPLGFQHVIQDFLTVRGTPLYLLSFLADLAAVIAAFIVIFCTVNRIAETIIASPESILMA